MKTKYQLETKGIKEDDGVNLTLKDGSIWTAVSTLNFVKVK